MLALRQDSRASSASSVMSEITLIEPAGDRERAAAGVDEGAADAVALRPPLVLDHDGAVDGGELGVYLGMLDEVARDAAVEARDRQRVGKAACRNPALAAPSVGCLSEGRIAHQT